jgi:hypothetical protein
MVHKPRTTKIVQIIDEPLRQIAEIVHMSFKDISSIIKRIDGQTNDIGTNLSDKSKETKALWLFENGKRPIDVAIELDMPYSEVVELQEEHWVLNQLYDLPLIYQELKYDFKLLKKNKMLSNQHILRILRYAGHELPSLENKIRKLTNDVIELEFRKKDLKYYYATASTII